MENALSYQAEPCKLPYKLEKKIEWLTKVWKSVCWKKNILNYTEKFAFLEMSAFFFKASKCINLRIKKATRGCMVRL